MAERQENSPYTLDAYNPFFTERKWTPFYKRHVFTGGAQTEQAANLITSPSFQKFWSGGGSQGDYTSGLRVDSPKEQAEITRRGANNKYNIDVDYKATAGPRPTLSIPPEGIRPIQVDKRGWPILRDNTMLGLNAQELHDRGAFRPAKFADIWPDLTPQEQAYWEKEIRGQKGYNSRLANWEGVLSKQTNIPIELRNISGALPREDRHLIRLLDYKYIPATENGLVRVVNASTPSNLLGVADELKAYSYGGGSVRNVSILPTVRHPHTLQYVTTTNPDVALAPLQAGRVRSEASVLRLFHEATKLANAKDEVDAANLVKGFNFKPLQERFTPLTDIPAVDKEPFAIPKETFNTQVRRVGFIQPEPFHGVDANGRPYTDSQSTTQTVVYGPPAKGRMAETILNNTVHYGGKTLGAVGAVSEGISIPWRKYQILNQMRAERGEAPMSEPYDINKFPEGGISDQIKSHMLATGEAFVNFGTMGYHDDVKYPEMRKQIDPVQRGYYSDNGQRVPNWVPNLQSTYQDRPRYERQGVSFNHLYPKAPR